MRDCGDRRLVDVGISTRRSGAVTYLSFGGANMAFLVGTGWHHRCPRYTERGDDLFEIPVL